MRLTFHGQQRWGIQMNDLIVGKDDLIYAQRSGLREVFIFSNILERLR